MEPLFPEENKHLSDLATDLVAKSNALTGRLHPVIQEGIGELVRSILNPAKFSLFLLKGERLEMSASDGWTGEDIYVSAFDSSSPLFQAVAS